MKYIVNLYTKNTYDTWGGHPNGFPENTYFFNTDEELIECLANLFKNKISGIYFTEVINEEEFV